MDAIRKFALPCFSKVILCHAISNMVKNTNVLGRLDVLTCTSQRDPGLSSPSFACMVLASGVSASVCAGSSPPRVACGAARYSLVPELSTVQQGLVRLFDLCTHNSGWVTSLNP
jgi:hypothetical protein